MKKIAVMLVISILISFSARAVYAGENQDGVSPPSTTEIEERMSLRRTILDWHQLLGMVTWGLWLATNYEGERALSRLYPRNEPVANYLLLQNPRDNFPLYYVLMHNSEWKVRGGSSHRGLASATVGFYLVTAGLALAAPSRYDETDHYVWDGMMVHKVAAILHLAAMLALPSLGKKIEHEGPRGARGMQNAGWGGFAAFSIAIAVFYF